MFTIRARNVNEALYKGLQLIKDHGVLVESRNGPTLELPAPVCTVYSNPEERVLLSACRDANPFFHLMESLWILAGRSDVKFLTEFNKRMADYSDDGVVFNAPYGQRIRSNFEGHHYHKLDQLATVIDILKKDPNSRQAVCQIWDVRDLDKQTKDKACNMSIVFRVRGDRLDMTVYNRSNDMIWGAYGANVVQFSMIQEYVAANIGKKIGTYYQISNSFHVYLTGPAGTLYDSLSTRYAYEPESDPYPHFDLTSITTEDVEKFDKDLITFFSEYDNIGFTNNKAQYHSVYFVDLVIPMLRTYLTYKREGALLALKMSENIVANDWGLACDIWLKNRIKK